MGLDMYLSRKTYIGGNYEHNEISGSINITKQGKTLVFDLKKLVCIEESVAYWRKQNHIHQWFVDNCGDGEDNCQEISVDDDDFKKLLDSAKKVIESLDSTSTHTEKIKIGWGNGEDIFDDVVVFDNTELAEDLLPTQGGFFFGSTLYDEEYLESLKDLVVLLNEIIENDGDYEYYYSASW
jgi:hypothetical protein